MTRARPTKAVQAIVLKRQRHRCNGCDRPLSECESFQWDHWQPRCLGGADDARNPANWQALCIACHGTKSAREVGMKAKADRLRRKAAGDWPKTKHPLEGRGFDKRFATPLRGRRYLKVRAS